MNERIKELAEQARKALAISALGGGEFNMKTYEEKFAELIIRECADVALREDHEPSECILRHFGVEQ